LEKLKTNGVSEEEANQLRACIDRAEFARFAPGSDNKETRKDLLDNAKDALRNVEKALNR